MVQTCISSRKQHSSRLALMKCCEAVLRESRDLLGTVTQGTGISCHHCCVTLNYSHKVQLIPHWCQAGITQLVWKLWFIHFTESRADLRGKPGHLDTAALALCHSSVADRVLTLTPAVQTKTSLPSWTIYQRGSLGSAFCAAPPELQTALCLWQLHIHHGINRKAKTPACFNHYIDNTKAKFRVYQALFISKTCTCHIIHSRRGFQPFHILM